MPRSGTFKRALRWLLIASMPAAGCRQAALDRYYLGTPKPTEYVQHASGIEYSTTTQETPEIVQVTLQPHTVREDREFEMRPIKISEAIMIALQNAQVVRNNAQFLSPGNPLMTAPNQVTSVYDPAIQASGVLFGNRGVEAALAAFDATFTSSMVWGRNEVIPNSQLRRVVSSETAAFQSAINKTFANGGQASLQHNVDYLGTNAPGTLFPSAYTGNLIASYRQPLLAGAGVEFTRVAGPIGQSFGGITGVSQGVVIARINNDLQIADFEGDLQLLVMDVESAYWDLYLAYRNFNTAVVARDAAQGTWELADKQAPAILLPADEAQARDQLFAARAAVLNTRSQVFTAETRLRRLMGLPVNDGTMLQPADEPVTAEVVPEWYSAVMDALTNRVELRAQKWNIRSLELQLEAARSLTQPRLDLVASWQVNGFGDQLWPVGSPAPGTPPSYQSMYERMTAGSEQGWNAGVQLNIPIGFRQAHAQVRNYELRVAKARRVLAEQEKEVAQELAFSFQEVARTYNTAVENFNRYQAAVDNVEKLRPAAGATLNVDVILRAQERRATAEVAYYSSLLEYNRALAALEYRKGTILAHNNVHIQEGPWTPAAYEDAHRRYEQRSHSWDTPWKDTVPTEYASHSPVGTVHFQTEEAARALNGGTIVSPEPIPANSPPPSAPGVVGPQNPMPPGGLQPNPMQPAPMQQVPVQQNPMAPNPMPQSPMSSPPARQAPLPTPAAGVEAAGRVTMPGTSGGRYDPFAMPGVRSPLDAGPIDENFAEPIQPIGWWDALRRDR